MVALGTYGRPGVLLNPELLSEHEGDANARGVVFGRFRESWVVEQNLQTQEIGRWPEDNSRAWRKCKGIGQSVEIVTSSPRSRTRERDVWIYAYEDAALRGNGITGRLGLAAGEILGNNYVLRRGCQISVGSHLARVKEALPITRRPPVAHRRPVCAWAW